MSGFVIFLIIAMALVTAGTLAFGIHTMASGKDISGHKQNKLMWLRVMFQGIAVMLIFLLGMMVAKR